MAAEISNVESDQTKLNPVISFFNSLISFLFSKWLLITIFVVIGASIGIWIASKSKPIYKSRLTFALEDGGNSGGLGSAMGIAAQLGFNIGSSGDIFSGDNIVEILKSRRNFNTVMLSIDTVNGVATTMIDRYLVLDDWKNRNSKNPRISDIHFPVGTIKENLTYLQDSILYITYVNFISQRIFANRPDKKLTIYEVNVQTGDEVFTKKFTDRLVSATSIFYKELRTRKSRETLEALEARVAATRGQLNSSISDRAVTQDANLNPAFATAQVPLQRQQVNIQTYGGAYGELYKSLELARFQYLKEAPLLQIIDAADYPMQKIKLTRLKGGIVGICLGLLIGVFLFSVIHVFSQVKKGMY